ncbi:formimidoylglutamate deiminase [Thalassotalea sp. PS06]|uniref:formimidoylglutamate deiminase n=1 Tax=Thalassotalea sp. PS06 TaxID=2594005 RepID=UPI001162A7B0|nr:formimidoylglutamate deiminase [Thalassotalea sp. PS06]QDO99953.1 formimidoylglutamate deiminase [Thalassotalea sp. PS06]
MNQHAATQHLFAKDILLDNGWQHDKTLIINNGIIADIIDGKTEPAVVASGPVIPGMVNCHSHAFQRGFAGFSEQGSEGNDSFWTWRKIMYKFVDHISPEQAQVIARQLYIEMLKAGYTRVAEFHYLHHDSEGKPYPELSTMAKAVFKAASESGIGITMLPVLYRFSGFGPLAPTHGQRRFINSVEQFNQLVSDCIEHAKTQSNANVGIAPHSLRAVDLESLQGAVAHLKSLDDKAPVHIHIAEQMQEVNDCLVHYQKRPVQWLLDNIDIDSSWCLIHATHIDDSELKGIVETGAIAGICPTTEANLGDGIFPTVEFLEAGGRLAIGSDSHISVNACEELKLLEYAQRLQKQQRAVLATTATPSVGRCLWQHSTKGGAISTASNTGEIAIGRQADLLVLDQDKLRLYAGGDDYRMDSFIFASASNAVRDVMVLGQWVIQQYQHPAQQQSTDEFAQVIKQLSAGS